ncbi:MAG: PAS domain S-box protein, partial [Acidobacteriota bacterium]|nr:PAS domain S-box protein [Acidobacteriota bacterium]
MASETIANFRGDNRVAQLTSTLGKMEVALGAISEAIVWTDRRGRIQWCNATFDRLVDRFHLEVLGSDLTQLLHLKSPAIETCALASGCPVSGQYEFRRGNQDLVLEISATPIEMTEHESSVVLAIRDVTEQHRTERALREKTAFVELLEAVATAANEARSFHDALEFVVRRVCAHTGWPVGHAYRTASGPIPFLVSTGIWQIQDPERFSVLREVSEATRLLPGEGLPGAVLSSGQALWVADASQDTRFLRRELAGDLGVRAALVFPVRCGKEIVAVLEFFTHDIVAPDEALLEIMAQIGTQLGQVAERERSDAGLRESEEQYRNLFDNCPAGIYRSRQDGTIAMANPSFLRMLGYATLAELAASDTLSAFLRHRRNGVLEWTGVCSEAAWVKKDGTEILVRDTVRCVR